MHTVTADKYKRIRLPSIKPGQVFDFEDAPDGSVKLTPVKAEFKEPFPPGSLAYLCTPARNKELDRIAKGTIIGVPKEWAEEREK